MATTASARHHPGGGVGHGGPATSAPDTMVMFFPETTAPFTMTMESTSRFGTSTVPSIWPLPVMVRAGSRAHEIEEHILRQQAVATSVTYCPASPSDCPGTGAAAYRLGHSQRPVHPCRLP